VIRKLIGLFLAVTFTLSACATALQETATATPPATPTPATVILTAVPSAQASATQAFVPKQNDLIFIEFFAIT